MQNIGKMMKQAQQMQAKLQQMQEEMAALEIEGASGAGMVKAVVTGKGEVRSVKIDPKIVDPEDVEMLEDLVVAALNDAKGKADTRMQEETEKLMGGLGLPPGMKMPF